MKTHTIYRLNTKHNKAEPIFSGQFNSFKECLEIAVNQGVDLHHANLKHANLSNANLDDAKLDYADFSHANLTGANLSESSLQHTIFKGTSLYNCCLAYSDLSHADLRFSNLGATDLTGSDLSYSASLISDAHKIDWNTLKNMKNCHLENNQHVTRTTSSPPLIIQGTSKQPIIVFSEMEKQKVKIYFSQNAKNKQQKILI